MRDMGWQVKDTYNRIGVYFSRSRRFLWPEMGLFTKKIKSGDSVLDLGCGNGRLLGGLPKGAKYLGVDFSEVMVEEAKRLWPGRRFVVGDLTDPDGLGDLGKYDAIFCVAVLHHISNFEKQRNIVRFIRKHLKKGGFAFISVWNLWQIRYWRWHLRGLLYKGINWRYLFVPFQKKHWRFCFAFDRKYLASLLEEVRFVKTEVFYVDKKGKKTNWMKGCNLCAVVKA